MATQNRAPTSDQSVSGTWTGSAGSRYAVVDDYPDASGADYLTHGTTAGYITFGFSAFSIPAGSTGISVQVRYYDKKNASQGCAVAGRMVVGGSPYNASTHNPANGTWTVRSDDWANNPKTAAAWTVDDVNGVGANALQQFGWYASDANPVIDLSCIEVQVTYTPPIKMAYVSWAETEVPTAPRKAFASWMELEVPGTGRNAEVSWAELETPSAGRRLHGAWAEMETPTPPRTLRVTWAEAEVPNVPTLLRCAMCSWGEFETPSKNGKKWHNIVEYYKCDDPVFVVPDDSIGTL